MSLLVLAAGPLATIQDVGRFGFRSFGVPISGPFDRQSALVANALLGNPIGTAVLEMTGFGGLYEAESTMAIAIAGAEMVAAVSRVDGSRHELRVPCATTLRPGDRLSLQASRNTKGHRTDLAVRGGWLHGERLGSRSDERPISTGSRLFAESSETPSLSTDLGRIAIAETIRYLDGPDSLLLQPKILEAQRFRLRQDSNRIGVRFEGDPIVIASPSDRLSTPVTPGTIQIAGGQPIVLGPACGTMGGYPHVGQVLTADLDRLGQLRPGSLVMFRRVEIGEARNLDSAYRTALSSLWLRLAIGRSLS